MAEKIREINKLTDEQLEHALRELGKAGEIMPPNKAAWKSFLKQALTWCHEKDALRTENAELKRERDQACEAIRDIGVIADANLTFAGDWRTYLFAAIQAYVNKIQEQGERIAELEAALEKALSCGQPCAGWDNKRGWKEAKAALEEE
jgi:hypothetical protein